MVVVKVRVFFVVVVGLLMTCATVLLLNRILEVVKVLHRALAIAL